MVDPLPVDNLEKAEQPRISDESDPKVENVAPPADSYDEYEADWSAPVQDPCGGLATDAGDEVANEASPQAGSSTDALRVGGRGGGVWDFGTRARAAARMRRSVLAISLQDVR